MLIQDDTRHQREILLKFLLLVTYFDKTTSSLDKITESFRRQKIYLFHNPYFFDRSHPLMDSAVRYEGDAPAFYKRDLVLTTLVVDKQFVDMVGDDITYTIFYAGTSRCNVH